MKFEASRPDDIYRRLRALLECDCPEAPVPFITAKSIGVTCVLCGAHAWVWRDRDKSAALKAALFGEVAP